MAIVRRIKLTLAYGCLYAAAIASLLSWIHTGVDTDALAMRMLNEGYLLAPVPLLHAERRPGTLMRINFATTQEATFWKVFAHLRDGAQKQRLDAQR